MHAKEGICANLMPWTTECLLHTYMYPYRCVSHLLKYKIRTVEQMWTVHDLTGLAYI